VHRNILVPALEALLTTKPAAAWIELLGAAGIPCGVVHDVAEAFAYARAVGLDPVATLEREDGATVDTVANPVAMSLTPARYRTAPPRLGEHSDQIRAARTS
jgi:crotonobetainyl-CoA:carnitine CoA-transferase CaiB-like acyl-CoA transferase